MIDIENKIYTIIKEALIEEYGDANFNISSVEQNAPAKFPAVSFVESDNYTDNFSIDSNSNENFANVLYEVNVYSNDKNKKKSECKGIISFIDDIMLDLGFTRSFLNPIPNADNSIYRMVARYVAKIDKNNKIYRR